MEFVTFGALLEPHPFLITHAARGVRKRAGGLGKKRGFVEIEVLSKLSQNAGIHPRNFFSLISLNKF
jgi:hypothetical protein